MILVQLHDYRNKAPVWINPWFVAGVETDEGHTKIHMADDCYWTVAESIDAVVDALTTDVGEGESK